ncbi:hypothetical protein C3V43_10505 [Bacteroides heparinolyticus]|uniref:hypothetical protein n=1 Tax=Prevotella heparinolytica TaxID=28113 RepID=UPI000D0227F1|nr:hypothetical protein [Bacteroides heparinolyticus]AVM58134.1 hypothetical protein C3V43_10505 [Bacteroides heparinolyticus]
MKRYLFCLFSLLFSSAVCAQEYIPRHEFFAGYGLNPTLSLPEPGLPLNTYFSSRYSTGNERLSGVLNAGYLYHASRSFAIGVTYSFLTVKQEAFLGSSDVLGKISNDCHLLMLTGKFTWLRLNGLSFYSRAGVGLAMTKKYKIEVCVPPEDPFLKAAKIEDGKSAAWQVMLAGVEWNFAKPMAVFAEGGMGGAGCGIAGLKLFF